MVAKNQYKHPHSTSPLSSQKENASSETTGLQQGLSESGAIGHGRVSNHPWRMVSESQRKEKARVPTCSAPRQFAGRGAAPFPPSAPSETARGSRTCAAAETKQEGNGSLLGQKVK